MKTIGEICKIIDKAHYVSVSIMDPSWSEKQNAAKASLENAQHAINELTQHPEKEKAIPFLKQSTTTPDIICDALVAVGTEEAIRELYDLFMNNSKEGYIAKSLLGFGAERIKSLIPAGDFEGIVLSAFDFNLNEDYASLLCEFSSDEAIDRLIYMLFQTHRSQEYRNHAIEALIRIGEKVNLRLLEKLEKNWVSEQKNQQTQYRKDILKILAETGDESSLPSIRKIMKTDDSVRDIARKTIINISKRHDLHMEMTFYGDTLGKALKAGKSKLGEGVRIIKTEETKEEERIVTIEAFSYTEVTNKGKDLLKENEKVKSIVINEFGKKGIFGFGKRPDKYDITILKSAKVRILYKY